MRSFQKGVENEEKGGWRQSPEQHLSVKHNEVMVERRFMGQRGVGGQLLMLQNDPLNWDTLTCDDSYLSNCRVFIGRNHL